MTTFCIAFSESYFSTDEPFSLFPTSRAFWMDGFSMGATHQGRAFLTVLLNIQPMYTTVSHLEYCSWLVLSRETNIAKVLTLHPRVELCIFFVFFPKSYVLVHNYSEWLQEVKNNKYLQIIRRHLQSCLYSQCSSEYTSSLFFSRRQNLEKHRT
jgi:hypothetical protein